MKTYSATQLAQIAMRQVRFDLTLGEGNTLAGHFKTGGWASMQVERLRLNRYYYHRIEDENTRFWQAWVEEFFEPWPDPSTPEGQNEALMRHLHQLTNSLVYKAGNCGEMAHLSVLRLSELALDYLDPDEDYEIQVIKFPCVDHQLVRIRVKNEIALCDPWINFADGISFISMKKYYASLYETLSPSQRMIFRKYNRLIYSCLKYGISHQDYPYPFSTVDSFEEAFKLVSLHQCYHDTFLRNWHAHIPSIQPNAKTPQPIQPNQWFQLMQEIKNTPLVKKTVTYLRHNAQAGDKKAKETLDKSQSCKTTETHSHHKLSRTAVS